jgi:hypothetical protein
MSNIKYQSTPIYWLLKHKTDQYERVYYPDHNNKTMILIKIGSVYKDKTVTSIFVGHTSVFVNYTIQNDNKIKCVPISTFISKLSL